MATGAWAFRPDTEPKMVEAVRADMVMDVVECGGRAFLASSHPSLIGNPASWAAG